MNIAFCIFVQLLAWGLGKEQVTAPPSPQDPSVVCVSPRVAPCGRAGRSRAEEEGLCKWTGLASPCLLPGPPGGGRSGATIPGDSGWGWRTSPGGGRFAGSGRGAWGACLGLSDSPKTRFTLCGPAAHGWLTVPRDTLPRPAWTPGLGAGTPCSGVFWGQGLVPDRRSHPLPARPRWGQGGRADGAPGLPSWPLGHSWSLVFWVVSLDPPRREEGGVGKRTLEVASGGPRTPCDGEGGRACPPAGPARAEAPTCPGAWGGSKLGHRGPRKSTALLSLNIFLVVVKQPEHRTRPLPPFQRTAQPH